MGAKAVAALIVHINRVGFEEGMCCANATLMIMSAAAAVLVDGCADMSRHLMAIETLTIQLLKSELNRE